MQKWRQVNNAHETTQEDAVTVKQVNNKNLNRDKILCFFRRFSSSCASILTHFIPWQHQFIIQHGDARNLLATFRAWSDFRRLTPWRKQLPSSNNIIHGAWWSVKIIRPVYSFAAPHDFCCLFRWFFGRIYYFSALYVARSLATTFCVIKSNSISIS